MKASLSGKNKYLDRILSDGQFRMFLTTAFSGGWNFAFAVFNFVLAGIYGSFWFLTLGVYYFALGCMRGALVAHGRSKKDKRKPETLVRHVGIGLFIVSVIFCGTIVLSIMEGHSKSYNTIIVITMAAYTFYMLTLAIINIIKAERTGDIKTLAFRNVSLAGVSVSLFSLEKTMLATFTEDAAGFIFRMEAFTGAGFFLLIIALGINLIRVSKK